MFWIELSSVSWTCPWKGWMRCAKSLKRRSRILGAASGLRATGDGAVGDEELAVLDDLDAEMAQEPEILRDA